jgi:hypothetical protein
MFHTTKSKRIGMVMTELAEEADPGGDSCNHQYLAAVSLARDILGRA